MALAQKVGPGQGCGPRGRGRGQRPQRGRGRVLRADRMPRRRGRAEWLAGGNATPPNRPSRAPQSFVGTTFKAGAAPRVAVRVARRNAVAVRAAGEVTVCCDPRRARARRLWPPARVAPRRAAPRRAAPRPPARPPAPAAAARRPRRRRPLRRATQWAAPGRGARQAAGAAGAPAPLPLRAARPPCARPPCARPMRAPHAQVEIDKPLGIRFAQSKAAGGGLEVTSVSGNAAKSGIKVGDTVIYTSRWGVPFKPRIPGVHSILWFPSQQRGRDGVAGGGAAPPPPGRRRCTGASHGTPTCSGPLGACPPSPQLLRRRAVAR
jgi:hypothetical protein